MAGTITTELAKRLATANAAESIDVVIEMSEPPHATNPAPTSLSRQQAIAADKEAFQQHARNVEAAVAAAGGTVLGRVWLNQTLKVRVPVGALTSLASAAGVVTIDVTHPLVAE